MGLITSTQIGVATPIVTIAVSMPVPRSFGSRAPSSAHTPASISA
jgi:hypothetical protein